MARIELTVAIEVPTWGEQAEWNNSHGTLRVTADSIPEKGDREWTDTKKVLDVDFRWGSDESGKPVVMLNKPTSPFPKGAATIQSMLTLITPYVASAVEANLFVNKARELRRAEEKAERCLTHKGDGCENDEVMAKECWLARTAAKKADE